MRCKLHIFFTVKIQKFTPYAPFLPLVFLNNRIEILVSNRSKCVFLQNRNTSSNFVNVNKIGNQALYKAFCSCQQVTSRQKPFILLTDINVGQLDNFLFQSKQKNRKPEPAVKEHFRKVFLSFYFIF